MIKKRLDILEQLTCFLLGLRGHSRSEFYEAKRAVLLTLITSLLMISYTLNSLLCIEESIVGELGLYLTVMHLSTLLFYRYKSLRALALNSMLLCGVLFQYTHAFHTGGFYSNSVVWFSVIPLLSGVVHGKRYLKYWVFIAVLGVLSLLKFQDLTSNNISAGGAMWATLNVTLGYILINFIQIYTFLTYKEKNDREIGAKNIQIKKLLWVVSHDVGNHLTVIKLRNSVLRRKISDKFSDFTSAIERSTDSIEEILNDIKSFEAIHSGKGNIVFTNINLRKVIENSMFVFESQLLKKGIEVKVNIDKDICLFGSEVAIKNQIFNNLISNSIKFSSAGENIYVEACIVNKEVVITYSDNGEGMSKEKVESLFNDSGHTTSCGTAGEVGTGFGMPIMLMAINYMGGTVSVSSIKKEVSASDHGTVFTLRFPLRNPS